MSADKNRAAEVEVVVAGVGHAVIVVDDVLVQIWQYEAPLASFLAVLERCVRWRTEDATRPLWMLSIVGGSSPMPDAGSRAAAAALPAYFTKFVLVADGSGFRAAVVRSVLTSMQLLSRMTTPSPPVVATLDEGLDILVQESAGVVDAARVAAAVNRVRRGLRRA